MLLLVRLKTSIRMYYGSRTVDRIASGMQLQRMLHVQSPDVSTFPVK